MMITDSFPATFHELGYLYAAREHRPWYLVERGEMIGLTEQLRESDEMIATYEDES